VTLVLEIVSFLVKGGVVSARNETPALALALAITCLPERVLGLVTMYPNWEASARSHWLDRKVPGAG
jgi:hypothetical protein